MNTTSAWQPPEDWLKITAIDAHTAGEPLRVITSGYPELPGATILEKRRYAKEYLDHLRKAIMWEPRGHADMYGCLVTGLGKREFNAFNLGRERVIEQFEKELKSGELKDFEAKLHELDIWLLKNFVHFIPFIMPDEPLDRFLPRYLSVLPGKLGLPDQLKDALHSPKKKP